MCRRIFRYCCSKWCSLIWIFLSAWGAVQFFVLAGCFYFQTAPLYMDVPFKPFYNSPKEFYKDAEAKYELTAMVCFVSGIIYTFTFLIAIQRYYANVRIRD